MVNRILRNILSISTMLTLSTLALSQVTYTTIGDIAFGSDGSAAQKIGGTTFINKGDGSSSTAVKIGGTTFKLSTEIERLKKGQNNILLALYALAIGALAHNFTR